MPACQAPSGRICARVMTGFQRACSARIKASNSAALFPTANAESTDNFSRTTALRVALTAPASSRARFARGHLTGASRHRH